MEKSNTMETQTSSIHHDLQECQPGTHNIHRLLWNKAIQNNQESEKQQKKHGQLNAKTIPPINCISMHDSNELFLMEAKTRKK